MRILCLVGIFDFPRSKRMWTRLETQFHALMPEADVVLAKTYLTPWNRKAIQAYTRHILLTYDDGTPTLLFGYSLGGIIAQHVAEHFQHTPIIGVFSLCSPLKLAPFWHFHWDPQKFVGQRVSIAGLLDPLVLYPLTRVSGVTSRHLWSDHLISLLFFNQASQKVAHIVHQYLQPRAPAP